MKLRKFLILVACCCWCTVSLQAQYNIKENSIWAFGYHAGLDFTSGSPVMIPTAMENREGYASISDTTGQLLFYTNGSSVWDRNHQLMPGSGNLFPPPALSPITGPSGTLVLPVLGHPDQYYLFSMEAATWSPYVLGTDPAVSRLWYSVIDLSLNGGMGDIDPVRKSIPLDSGLSATMTAVRGDQCNIWVITHDFDQNIFKVFEITAGGVNTQPVVSTLGSISGQYAYNESNMRVSPDRRKLALSSRGRGISGQGLEVYDFDPATGIVSNAMLIGPGIGGGTPAFSPDNSKLYVPGLDVSTITYAFWQYDLSQPTQAAITASRVAVDSPSQWIEAKLGPDGKIYHGNASTTIDRVNDPNQKCPACDFESDVITFIPGSQATYTFPSDYIRPMPMDTVYGKSLDTLVCPDGQGLTLTATPGFTNYVWDDGSSGNTRTVTQPGTYWVAGSTVCDLRVDTFVVAYRNVVPVSITVNGYILSTSTAYAAYQWYRGGLRIDGATNRDYTVIVNGDYTVKVTDNNGCTDSSNVYSVTNVSVRQVPYEGADVQIYPNPVSSVVYIAAPVPVHVSILSLDGKTILRGEGVRHLEIGDLSAGVYLISVTDMDGRLLRREKLVKTIE
jgi:hypothetical protein